MLGRLRTYPQPVFAQGPFLQHESLSLLVPHSVPALRLHGVKVEAEGLAGKEDPEGFLVTLSYHLQVVLFRHRHTGLIYLLPASTLRA